MTPSTRAARALTAIVAAALAAVACTDGDGGTASTPTPAPAPTTVETPSPTAEGGSFKYQLRYDPEFIDPGFVLESEGFAVVDVLFDSLLEPGPDLEPRPAAAERWEANPEGTVFTFHLDPDATFHDGTPVTAADFVRAFNRVVGADASEPSPNSHHLSPVAGYEESRTTGAPLSGVEAVDDHTLRITLQYPDHSFAAVVTHPSLAPVPEAAESDLQEFREQPIGNGPFAMAERWRHEQFVRVTRFEDYSRRVPALDEIVFRIYGGDADEDEAYEDFEEGLLHFAAVPTEQLAQAVSTYGRSQDGYTGPGVLNGASLFLYYYGFNTTTPPFDDPEVRRALSMLIDREAIAKQLMRDTRMPARSLVPPPVPGSAPDTCDHCTFDPQAAAEVLADKGLTELTIAFNDHPVQARIADHVATDIRNALGIEVRLVSEEFEDYVDTVRAGEVGLFRLGWQAEYPSLDNFVWTLVSSTARGEGTNVFQYSDPEVDTLLSQARATADEAARRELYVQAERAALADAPLLPMLFYRHSRVVADGVDGFTFKANGLADMTRVRLTDTG